MKGAVNQNKLMVIVYGAYNLKTSVMMSRWKPYLDAGWTLAVAMVRGGGDYGDQWADDARRNKKYKSIEDVEAVIRAAQRQTGIGWKSTALYGRSAGGYIVGSVCSRHGNGGMIGMAYAEVPYVDVLRTTTNDSLPLTILEYDEFGNPRKRLEDFQTVLRLSPVDSLGEGGAPGIFVVASTSMNDREVLTYESMKWIQRLRGSDGEMKFLRILDGKGHFVKGSAADVQRYEDFLLLNAFTK
jgi:oligopeptidase B